MISVELVIRLFKNYKTRMGFGFRYDVKRYVSQNYSVKNTMCTSFEQKKIILSFNVMYFLKKYKLL